MSASMPTVATCRLTLRAMTADDTDPLHRVMGDREVMRYCPRTDPSSRERAAVLISGQLEHWNKHGYGWGPLDDPETREHVGWCGLRHLPKTYEVEVAYLLGEAHWGPGLATEPAYASVRFGFAEVSLETHTGGCSPAWGDPPSLRAPECRIGSSFGGPRDLQIFHAP